MSYTASDYVTALQNVGFSPAVSAGIAGNLQIESGFNPGVIGDNGLASGVAQWHPDRARNFASVTGVNPQFATPQQSAEFISWEFNNPSAAGMTQTQANSIINATTPEQAASLVDQYYERSNGAARNDRINAATQIAAGSGSSSIAGNPTAASQGWTGALNQIAQGVTHPFGNLSARMPDYALITFGALLALGALLISQRKTIVSVGKTVGEVGAIAAL